MVKKKFIIFLLIFAIISIFYSCSPTPVNAITDDNLQLVTDSFTSPESILGTAQLYVTISGANLQVGFGSNVQATLTNISGTEGVSSYTFQNGNLSASIRVADTTSIYVTLTSLKEPYFNLENVLCSK